MLFRRAVVFLQPPAKLLIQAQVALFQFCQECWALLGGASLAHDAMPGLSCSLLRWRLRGAIGSQFGRVERAKMVLVRVQRAG